MAPDEANGQGNLDRVNGIQILVIWDLLTDGLQHSRVERSLASQVGLQGDEMDRRRLPDDDAMFILTPFSGGDSFLCIEVYRDRLLVLHIIQRPLCISVVFFEGGLYHLPCETIAIKDPARTSSILDSLRVPDFTNQSSFLNTGANQYL